MKCRRCGVSWKLGNLSPKFDSCPICDCEFSSAPDAREFESVIEVLQVLAAENGADYWNNGKGISGYLNDYFPEKVEIRNEIKFLLEKKFGKKLIRWSRRKPRRRKVVQALEKVRFQGNIDDFSDGIMFLVGATENAGTDIHNAVFYETYARECSKAEYKIKALEKAIQCGAEEETAFVNALLRLAKIYEQGDGTERDYQKAVECLNKAVLQNSAEGLFRLGRLYMLGRGVPQNKERAIELFEKASAQNHPQANYQLYVIFYKDNNLRQKAFEKVQAAAENGYVPAMYEYALHLLYGELVLKNVAMALTILEKCALQGDEEAIEKLRYLERRRCYD